MKVDERALQDVHTVGGGELLPVLDLPPTPSPKLKAQYLRRVHKQGCPPEMHI